MLMIEYTGFNLLNAIRFGREPVRPRYIKHPEYQEIKCALFVLLLTGLGFNQGHQGHCLWYPPNLLVCP